MRTLPEIEKLIHSPLWTQRLKGVEEAIEILKMLPDNTVMEQLGSLLLELVNDPKWEVRNAIPRAAIYFEEGVFYKLINPLLEDSNAYVIQAAEQVLQRRARQAYEVKKPDREYEDVNRILEVIASRTNPEIKKLASRLKDLARQVAIGEVYHEIQKLLAPVSLWIENIQNDPEQKGKMTDETAQLLWDIEEQSRLISAALLAIKKYNEASSDGHQMEDVESILNEAIKTAMDAYATKPAKYKYHVVKDIPSNLQTYGNREDLKMALSNIILNGLEALDKNGWVHVSAKLGDDAHIVLGIKDTGRGMSEKLKKSSCTLFKSSKKGHIGMGLPLAKKIIQQEHQGEIQIESRKGEGTVVTILLSGKPPEE